MKLITVGQMKGGVSKTTTSITLGEGLARMGHSVTLVDADFDQHSLTENYDSKFDVAKALVTIDPEDDANKSMLEAWVNEVSSFSTDYVVIDMSPAAKRLLGVSAGISDMVIFPITTGVMSVRALSKTLKRLDDMGVGEETKRVLVPAMVKKGTSAHKTLDTLMAAFNSDHVTNPIFHRQPYEDCLGSGESIFSYVSPSHDAYKESWELVTTIHKLLED